MGGLGINKIVRNPVKYNLHNGLPAVGTWLGLCSPVAAESIARVGWDWVVVDAEHSPVGFETMVNCFRAAQLGGAAPMARVPWNDTIWIQRTLDAGALGLVIPMINNVADAKAAVANTKYSTRGLRSFGGSRVASYIEGDYRTWADENIAVIVMIETAEAVKNAEAILAVDGVDGCFIGPNDLALSMGLRRDQIGPGSEHEAAMLSVLAAGQKVGTAVGKHCFSAEEVNQRIEQGFQFLALSSDAAFMAAEASSQFKRLKLTGIPAANAPKAR
jgi:4-hydroxy-2-oxoheptanedioate aldolase